MHAQTHLATRVAAATSTNHVGLHRAAPPGGAGAGCMVNNRQVGLLQFCRQLTTSWGEHQKPIINL